MAVTFDITRAQVDAAYRAQAVQAYQNGELEINERDLQWLLEVTGTTTDETVYDIDDDDLTLPPPEDNPPEDNPPKGAPPANNPPEVPEREEKVIPQKDVSNKANEITDMALATTALGLASGLVTTTYAAPIIMAIGTKYIIQQPNKDEYDELMILKDAMESGNLKVANAIVDVENSQNNIQTLDNNLEIAKAEIDLEIKQKQIEMEEKQARYQELADKQEAGETLTDEEQEEMKALSDEIETLKTDINTLNEKKIADAEDAKKNIDDEQEVVEEADDVFKTVDDVAKYAESFDEGTKERSVIEVTAQSTNVAAGSIAIGLLSVAASIPIVGGFFAPFLAMAAAGTGMSTLGVGQQSKFIHDINDELEIRNEIQANASDLNNVTTDTSKDITTTTINVDETINTPPPEDPDAGTNPPDVGDNNPDAGDNIPDDDKDKKPEEE